MGLTLEQARSIGLAHLHPAMSRGRSAERELADRILTPSVAASVSSDGLNKTERRFRDDVLEPAYVRGDIARYWREPIKLRLAGHTYYTPDFLVEIPAGEHGLASRLVFVEVKGGWFRDDARVKTKVAASSYPCFGWLVVYAGKGHSWRVNRVTSSGFGGDITVPWINGG